MESINDILNIDADASTSQFKKGDILQRQGDISLIVFYVKKGLLKGYTIDNKGKEHIFMFAPEGWIIADTESQEFNKPAELFIECIENSEVTAMHPNLLTKSDLTTKQYRQNINLMARRIAVLQQRVMMLMSASAKDRYESFLEMYPNLLNRVPQRMIASYLGITPEVLSKIKSEISRSK